MTSPHGGERPPGIRGRVLAVDGDIAIVRAERGDLRVHARPTWRPGDLIDGGAVVQAYGGGDYPGPATEVARLTRSRIARLAARGAAMAALRRFFAERGFLEVETPLLAPCPGLELHLDAVAAGGGYLITSPEYQMKRLLAAGFERIYQVCKCFRAGERGPHHASEFTMLEWYRGFAELDAIRRDTEELVAEVVTAVAGAPVARVAHRSTGGRPAPSGPAEPVHSPLRAPPRAALPPSAPSPPETPPPGSQISSFSGLAAPVQPPPRASARAARLIDVTPPWPRLTVRDAMRRWAGVEIAGDEPAADLVAAVRAAGVAVADGTVWDDAFFAAFLARVDPALAALDRPVILEDWPVPLAALARRKPGDPLTALRFEVYIGGIELANAFGELTDPIEQRARFERDQAARRARGKPVYPIDDKLLAALAEGLPPSAGIALGVDRLIMLATGAETIAEVQTFAAGEL